MSWHPVFAAVKAFRDKQENDVALLAWLHEERWWQYDPEFYERTKAEAQAAAEEQETP